MKSIKGRTFLLIGGAGFIGHNLALEMKKKGANVVIVDGLQVNNFLSFHSAESKGTNSELYLKILNQRLNLIRKHDIPLYILDCRDYHGLSRLFNKIKPDTVFHLAAVAHASRSNKDPYTTFDHSFRTLENALDSSRDRIDHFIYFSSSMVYGHFKGGFVTEDTLCEPIGIYGALKYSGEKLVIAYNQVFDLPYTIIRPSALYGERCVSRRVGQIFIENIMQNSEIIINGDGNDRLDFTYIKDLVNGLIKVAETEESKGEIFNLTYGKSRSLNDMINILNQYYDNINVQYIPKDKLTPDRGTLCIDKAKRIIGYQPEYPLEKGFTEYIQWYKNFFAMK